MPEQSDALERAQAVLRESILAGHLEKHEMEQKAVDIALEAAQERLQGHRTAHSDAHTAHEKIHDVAAAAHREQHLQERRAIDVAVAAMDKRLDSMNQFRDQLREQAGDFVNKDVFEARFREIEKEIATERTARREAEGVKRGMSQTTAFIVGAITLVGIVLGILVVVINLATGT